MFIKKHFLLFVLLLYCGMLSAHKADTASAKEVTFVKNCGQWHADVLFKAKLNNGALFAEKNGITYVLLDKDQLYDFSLTKTNPQYPHKELIDVVAYKMIFDDVLPACHVEGTEKKPYYHNYYKGACREQWQSGVPVYQSIHYKQLYQGVQLAFFQQEAFLKYEFLLEPGADAASIRFHYEGIQFLSLSEGNLIVHTAVGNVMEMKPYAYQLGEQGAKDEVSCCYQLHKNSVSFKLGKYDKTRSLIIDPVLIFSSYSGSTADNWGYSATYDNHGNLYGGGIANDIGYPVTVGAYQINFAGGAWDIAISKFDSSGSSLFFSTYIGGNQIDIPHSLVVNNNDELYVLGTTGSINYPVTVGAFDTTFNGGSNVTLSTSFHMTNGTDMVISKLSADGTALLSSTYLGGSGNDGLNYGAPLRKNYADEIRGEIVVDDNSNVYIASSTASVNFPVTAGAFQQQHGGGTRDGCVVKMNHNLTNLIWSSFFGGQQEDATYSLILASDRSVYVCGGTNSPNLPTTQGAFQPAYGGGTADGFLIHINENGNTLLQATYLGKGGYDQAYMVKTSRQDHPHVFGQTDASGAQWIYNALWNRPGGGQFITKFTPSLDTIIWSTAFGSGNGGPDISPTAFLVDLCQTIYLSGWGGPAINGFGGTNGLPVFNPVQATTDNNDYYFLCITDDASDIVFGSFFGGNNAHAYEHVDGGTSRFDNKGRIYQAVCAGCNGGNFPTTPGVWAPTNGSSNCNLGVLKLDFGLPVVVASFNIPTVVCAPYSLHFTNESQAVSDSTLFHWDFGDGTSSDQKTPTHLYTQGGIYTITLSVLDMGSCNFSDTMTRELLVLTNSTGTLETQSICNGDFVQIGLPPSADPQITYHWLPTNTLSNASISNPVAAPDTTTLYSLFINSEFCTDTLYQLVTVNNIQVSFSADTILCKGDSVVLSVGSGDVLGAVLWSLYPDFSVLINTDPLLRYITVAPLESTTYYVKVISGACSLVHAVNVEVASLTVVGGQPYLLCFEDSLQLSVQVNDSTGCHYQWTPSVLSGGDSASPWVNPPQTTHYVVTVTNAYGCTVSDTMVVTKRHDTFGNELRTWCDDDHIIEGTHTIIHVTDYGTGYSYEWTPLASLQTPLAANSVATPSATTTYTVIVTDNFGCTMSKSVTVEVEPMVCDEPLVFLPNAFSPNGDGKNDVLFIRSLIIDNVKLMIYDRWGELVFETQDIKVGWNGTYKGKMCKPGVYDYYLETICINGEKLVKKGNITLIY